LVHPKREVLTPKKQAKIEKSLRKKQEKVLNETRLHKRSFNLDNTMSNKEDKKKIMVRNKN